MIVSKMHPVEELVRSRPREVEWVLFDTSRTDRRSSGLKRLCRQAGVAIRHGDRASLDRLAGRGHQGVVARLASAAYAPREEVFEGERGRRFLLALDEVQDPQNLGAIVRVADAIGARVVVPERGSAPLSDAVGRASAGALHRVPVHRISNMRRFLDAARQEGFGSVGLDPAGEDIYLADLSGDIVLVLGNEGRGLRRLVREGCDRLVRLPMAGEIASLNVSTAAAAAGYEVVRQRQEKLALRPPVC
jgi:23S rRNA (guanosine2251-2'-O)-methyltransferase